MKVKQDNKFEIRDIKKALHDVRQFDANKTDITIQSFVFEPATRKVHLRFADGKGPATAGEFSTLDLNKLWGK